MPTRATLTKYQAAARKRVELADKAIERARRKLDAAGEDRAAAEADLRGWAQMPASDEVKAAGPVVELPATAPATGAVEPTDEARPA